MNRARFGAIRRTYLCALALTLSAASLSAQVVEKGRTLSDLIASHPCDTGLENRIARVTDCDSATDFGDGGGAFNCWAYCDGSAPWTNLSIGGGAGGGAATAVTGSATLPATCTEKDLYQDTDSGGTEFYVCTATNTWTATGTIGGTLTATDDLAICTDGTGGSTVGACTVLNIDNLRLDANTLSTTNANGDLVVTPNGSGGFALGLASTAYLFEVLSGAGNDTFLVGHGFSALKSDAQTARLTLQFINSTGQIRTSSAGKLTFWSEPNLETGAADTALVRSAAGIVGITDNGSGGGALHLNLLASPPRTCDATAEGDIYSDTSHALCWCDASAWQKLSGAGTCA